MQEARLRPGNPLTSDIFAYDIDIDGTTVVGGAPFPEPRHLWWNFVSSSEERLEQAKRDWRERRGDPAGPFPLVPGDEVEFIPLPDSR